MTRGGEEPSIRGETIEYRDEEEESTTENIRRHELREAVQRTYVKIPVGYEKFINPRIWAIYSLEQVPEDIERINALDTVICGRIADYTADNKYGQQLWSDLAEDFDEWTNEDFENADKGLIKKFRDFLVTNGVYVNKTQRGTVASRVYNAIKQEEYDVWDEKRIAEVIKTNQAFRERMNSKDFAENVTDSYVCTFKIPVKIPPDSHENNGPTPRQLTDLIKLYSDDAESKYGGKAYDTIDSKLPVFYDLCASVGITSNQYGTAIKVMLTSEPREYYSTTLRKYTNDFDALIAGIKSRFEGEEVHRARATELRRLTFESIERQNNGKSKLEVLNLLIAKITKLVKATKRHGLPEDEEYRDALIDCCQGIPECAVALLNPPTTFNALCAQLRGGVGNMMSIRDRKSQFIGEDPDDPGDQYWVDRKYNGQRNRRLQVRWNNQGATRDNPQERSIFTTKKCFVCGKPGCWSNKHPGHERQKSFQRYKSQYFTETSPGFEQFLAEYEGDHGLDGKDDDNNNTAEGHFEDDIFFTSTAFYGKNVINGREVFTQLRNQATYHALTKEDLREISGSNAKANGGDDIFTFEDRYSATIFQGIMPDTGAARVSTAGQRQVAALREHLRAEIPLDTARAGEASIRFGSGKHFESLGAVKIPTPLGELTFHVMTSDTPFLFCLKDMDRHGIRFDNLKNVLIQGKNTVPVVRKW
ncbi:hypothetical protein LX36DRAFT_617431, partial [Colletotrichum falcatum]